MAWLALLALPAALSCRSSHNEDCGSLLDALGQQTPVLNRAVERLADVQRDPTVIENLREAVTQADAALGRLPQRDPTLAKLAASYRAQLQTALALADDLAAAHGDASKLNGAVRAADGLLGRQDAILRDLHGYCANAS